MAVLCPLEMSGITLILQALRHTSECDSSFFDLAHFCRNTYVYTGRTSKLADCVVTFHSFEAFGIGRNSLEKSNKAILFLDTGVACLVASGSRVPPGGLHLARKCRQTGLVQGSHVYTKPL